MKFDEIRFGKVRIFFSIRLNPVDLSENLNSMKWDSVKRNFTAKNTIKLLETELLKN